MITAFVLVGFLLVPGWFVYRLVREPGSWALRSVVALFVLRLVDSPQVMAILRTTLGLTPASEKLIKNLSLAAACYCLLLFFLFSARGTWRRAVQEGAVLLVVATTLTIAVVTTPNADEVYPTSRMMADTQHPSVLLFYVVGNGYFGYALGRASVWAWHYAAEASRRSALGLRVASVGLAAFAIMSLVRVLTLLIPDLPRAVEQIAVVVTGIAITVFVIGVCWSGAATRWASLRVWLRHRRLYRQLGPLWRVLHEAFPDTALDHQPEPRGRDLLPPGQVHWRFWRRLIEVRDGLVQLSPQLADAGWDHTQPPHTQAGSLREALRRHHAGVSPSSNQAVLIAAPEADRTDVESDAAQLVQLSHTLDTFPTQMARP